MKIICMCEHHQCQRLQNLSNSLQETVIHMAGIIEVLRDELNKPSAEEGA